MIILTIDVDDIAAVIAAGYTLIRVYTDESDTGPFTTLAGTVSLAAGSSTYTFTHTAGTSSDWYKTAYFGTTPGEGTKSAALKGDTATVYATGQELKAMLNIENVDKYDSILDDIVLAASIAIDHFCNRQIDGFNAASAASAREFMGDGRGIIRIDPFVVITAIAVKATFNGDYEAWLLSDVQEFSGSHERPNFNNAPFTGLMITPNSSKVDFTSGKGMPSTPTVRATCNWGFVDFATPYGNRVEALLKMACIAQAGRWFARAKAGWSDAIAPAGLGAVFYTKQLDGDIRMMLSNNGLIDETL